MKHVHKHFIARLFVGAFLVLGIGFWMSKFVAVDAANWTLPGGSGWDNMTSYLDTTFWSNNPTSGDIIAALYGSGDTGSIYTTNWSGYTSGSCLSGGMSVMYTGAIPTTLSSHTIYVITSGTYNLSTGITMAECSALISSGVVTLSGDTNSIGTVMAESGNNVIIENMWITKNPQGYGIQISGMNFCVHGVKAYNNYGGIRLYHSSYGKVIHAETYGNTGYAGLYLSSATNIVIDTLNTYDNISYGINHFSSSGNILSGITASGNSYGVSLSSSYNTQVLNSTMNRNDNSGLHIYSGSNNQISNSTMSDNGGNGIYVDSGNNNQIANSTMNDNGLNGIYVDSGNNNQIANSTMNDNGLNGIYISASDSNTISGCVLSGNRDAGINLADGNSNQIANSTINGNDWYGLYIYSGSYNQIVNSTINDNEGYGILFSSAHSGAISGCSLAGNGEAGIDLSVSTNSTITNSHDYYTGGYTNYQSLSLWGGRGTIVSSFVGSGKIYGQIESGYSNTDIANPDLFFDADTQANNYIIIGFSPYAVLTGNAIATGTTFVSYTDRLSAYGYNQNGDRDVMTISGTNTWTISGAEWDGKMYAPVQITTGNKKAILGETGTAGLSQIIDTIEAGTTGNTILVISGGETLVDYYITGGIVGQYVRILKSTDGATWTTNTAQSGCVLDYGSLCSFTDTGVLKLFAFGGFTLSFSGVTQANVPVVSGGYYNTGVSINFTTGDNFSGATLSGIIYTGGTIITGNGRYVFILTDTLGNSTGTTFTIDTTNPVLSGTYPTTGLSITGSNGITFTWSGTETNLSGYTLYILSGSIDYASGSTGNSSSLTLSIINGSGYSRYVVATDKAGNTGASATIPFSLNVPLSGTIALSGTEVQMSGSAKYIRTTFPIYLLTNITCAYTVTGDSITTQTGTLTGNTITTVSPTITGADVLNTIYVSLSTGNQHLYQTLTGYRDNSAPGVPSLTTPATGAMVTGAFTLTWTAVTDTGVGISGYTYVISTSTGLTIDIHSTTGTSASIVDGHIGTSGSFYRKVIALDKLGNRSISETQPFSYTGSLDLTPNTFTFDIVSDARLDRVYLSSEETIAGLTAGQYSLASVSRGVLYINDIEVGSSGLVDNGDIVSVELISSDEYEHTVYSTLSIGTFSTRFTITTEAEDTDSNNIHSDLSNTQKLQIASIFLSLKDVYTNTQLRITFLNTLLSAIQIRIDDLDTVDDKDAIDALQYLYDLAETYLGDNIDTDVVIPGGELIGSDWYTAPNGKVYQVTYSSTTKLYTSPNFMSRKTFTTLDAMKAYIDSNNGGGSSVQGGTSFSSNAGRSHTIDTSWASAPYTAPNGKIYRLFKTTDGRYSSYNFSTAKYFISVDALKNHIYWGNK